MGPATRPCRIALFSLITALTLAACTRDAGGKPQADAPPATPDAVSRSADIYAAVIGKQNVNFGHFWIVDRLCPNADEMSRPEGCLPMPADVKAALKQRYPDARFISNPQPLQRRIFDKGGGIIFRLGPIRGSTDLVQVAHSYYCGGECASGGTSVLELEGGTWTVTGSVGGSWIS